MAELPSILQPCDVWSGEGFLRSGEPGTPYTANLSELGIRGDSASHLLDDIGQRLEQQTETERLFVLRWGLK